MDSAPPDWGSRARGLSCLYGMRPERRHRGSARGWAMGRFAPVDAPAPYQLSRTRHIVSPKGEPNTQTIARLPGLIVVAYRSGFLTLIAVTLQSPASLTPHRPDPSLSASHLLTTTDTHSWSRSYARQLGKISQPWHANPNTTSSNTVMQIRRWRRVGG